MSHWNNRICRSVDDQGEEYFTIREVFYNDEGGIVGYTQDPIAPLADTTEDLIHQIELILKDCRERDVLDLTTVQFAPRDRRLEDLPDLSEFEPDEISRTLYPENHPQTEPQP